jgi:transcriptional regulator with XRE-family HTH domain
LSESKILIFINWLQQQLLEEICCMAFHIGEIIKAKAESKGFTQQQLGEKINTSKQNVRDIYTRQTIDTGLLTAISVVLEYDFFQHYYEEAPLQSISGRETDRLKARVAQLEELLEKNELEIKRLGKELAAQEKIVVLMEAQAAYITKKSKNQ